VVNVDFTTRFVKNLVYEMAKVKSSPYFVTLDKIVSAKSILGILNADIHKGDVIRIEVFNENETIAMQELEDICKLIRGD
jgi:PTS HPr component phosphorylation site.